MSSTSVPGNRGERPRAVLRVPAFDHLVDRLAVAEPAEEALVDRDGRVGGEHEAGDRLDLLAWAGDAEEAAEQLEAVGRVGERLGDLRQRRERQEVRERTVGLLGGELEHLAAQRRDDDRDRFGGRRAAA